MSDLIGVPDCGQPEWRPTRIGAARERNSGGQLAQQNAHGPAHPLRQPGPLGATSSKGTIALAAQWFVKSMLQPQFGNACLSLLEFRAPSDRGKYIQK